MRSARSSSSCRGAGCGGVAVDLSLTGLPVPVLRRPSSASPAKHVARSLSVVADGKPKRNALEDAGSRAINNLRRSNSTTQVAQRASSGHRYGSPGTAPGWDREEPPAPCAPRPHEGTRTQQSSH
ncbi:centrosomal protein of 131 kDa [Aix galericulata]|nr:centrosomal protein of 131 kDa [Aix galericulata]